MSGIGYTMGILKQKFSGFYTGIKGLSAFYGVIITVSNLHWKLIAVPFSFTLISDEWMLLMRREIIKIIFNALEWRNTLTKISIFSPG